MVCLVLAVCCTPSCFFLKSSADRQVERCDIIVQAIYAYKVKYERFPDELSQLVPEFIDSVESTDSKFSYHYMHFPGLNNYHLTIKQKSQIYWGTENIVGYYDHETGGWQELPMD
jgi:hypothetical protein